MQKGITKDIIISEAENIIVENGIDGFSLRTLAGRLNIKPASLYNHISGIEELYHRLAVKSSERMQVALSEAMEGKNPDDAFIAGAFAYREYADNNREMYLVLMRSRLSDNRQTSHLAFTAFSPMRDLISEYIEDKRKKLVFIRSLRAFLHGFIEVTHVGFMQLDVVSRDETFLIAVKKFLSIMKEDDR